MLFVDSRKLFYSFFASELSRGYVLEHDEARYTEKTQKVYTFIKIPKEVERVSKCCYVRSLNMQFHSCLMLLLHIKVFN